MVGSNFKTISVTFLDEVASSEEVLASFDEVIRDWTVRASICFDILREKDHLLNRVWNLLNEKSIRPIELGFFNWIRRCLK